MRCSCPHCRAGLDAPPSLWGGAVRCPACRAVFTAPAPSVEPVSPAAPLPRPAPAAPAAPAASAGPTRPLAATSGPATTGTPPTPWLPAAMHAAYRVFAWSLLLYLPLSVLTILVVGGVDSSGQAVAGRRGGAAADLLQVAGESLGAATLLSLLALLLGMLATGRSPHFRGPAFYSAPTWRTRAVAVLGIVCLPLSVLVFGVRALRQSFSPPPASSSSPSPTAS